ncbi:MAG: hypothetical protein OEY92_03645 [Elusimicrobiota bacterium]|nr:hypothetical protein [Elusimicrobiota bacterium]
MKRLIGLLIVLAILFIVYDSFIKERWLINKGIKEAKQLIEEKKFAEAFDYVSRNYEDRYGNDYQGLKSKVEDFLKGFGDFKIYILRKRKKFESKRCDLYLLAVIEASHRELGYLKGKEFLKLSLIKENDGVWRVVAGESLE